MTKCNNCMFMCIEKTNEERINCKNFITPKDNEELENQNKELIQKISELEAQLEKMKCCSNCKYRYTENFPTQTEPCNKCLAYSHSKWELAE